MLLLARDLETRLAVNALPKELRDGAAVMVLESNGYVKVRSGTNAFTCIVSRRGGNFYPVCFDEEGTCTILTAFADDAVFRMKGSTEQEIEQKLAEGFEQGRYRPPSRPGIVSSSVESLPSRARFRLVDRLLPERQYAAPHRPAL